MLFLLLASAFAAVPMTHRGTTYPRPEISGTAEILDGEDGFFRIHFARDGADAVSGRDDDANGLPDYVERVLAALEYGRTRYAEDGWRPAVRDTGLGGSDALDVYLKGVDINGYAYPLVDEDPAGGFACFIEVDSDLVTAGQVLESIVVHELHHCIEFQYGLTDAWIHEGTATAEQYDLVSDLALQLAVNVLWDERLGSPQLPIDDRSGRYEYAAFSFFKFWSDTIGARPEFWESLATVDGYDGFAHAEQAAADAGFSGFPEVFLAWQLHNAFACGRDDGQHYLEDSLSCTSSAEVPYEALQAGTSAFRSDHESAPFTTTFHDLPAGASEQAVEVRCTAEAGSVRVALAAVDRDGLATEEVLSDTAEARLDRALDPEGLVRIVVTSNGDVPARASCTVDRIPPVPVPAPEEDGNGCSCSYQSSAEGWWLIPLLVVIGRRRTD